VEEVGSRNLREELAFSRNFPVAPCANIYREYRDLCKLPYVRVRSQCSAHTRTIASCARRPAVCIEESCEYMHKNVCFRVPAPLSSPCPELSPYRCPPLHLSCLYTDGTTTTTTTSSAPERRAYAQRENVFGSGTYQPNVNLSDTSRNDYAHDLHRRAVVQSCICAAVPARSRVAVDADTRP